MHSPALPAAELAALEHPRHARLRALPLLLLLATSGACALVWQMVWTARFAIAFGHEMAAVLAVLGAFFAGLAGGAWLLAGPIERSARPGLWYAALEILIGAWGLAVTLALPALAPLLAQWLGPQPAGWLHATAALLLPLVVLLPATLAMGATLPCLERQLRGHGAGVLPLLYAGNTAGADAGVLLAVFVTLPELGTRITAILCAEGNVACGVIAVLLWRRERTSADSARTSRFRMDATAWRLVLTGLLGIAYEVLTLRVLAQVSEGTVYTYALLLAMFLLGTAGGAAVWRRAAADVDLAAWTDRLLLWLAWLVFTGTLVLFAADWIVTLPARWMGTGLVPALLGEALMGAAALLPATFVMGALFPVLCRRAQEADWPLGRAFALNTAGAACAPALVGAALAPALGARIALALVALGYLALRSACAWQRPHGAIAGAAIAALALLGPPLRFIAVPEGGRILLAREGAAATVSVVADADNVARLHINNRVQEGSTAGGSVEVRLAQIPLLLHAQPHEALFLGLGTGYTAHAAALDGQVHVRAVELLPEVVRASSLFMLRPTAPRAASPVDIVTADARRYLLADDARYDVIVADLFHPARSGAGSLYTVEHFRSVRARLAPGGVFCQWLALHQMDLATLRSIVASFLAVYPQGMAVLASNGLDSPVIGLVARPDRPQWTFAEVQARLAAPRRELAAALQLARLDATAVLGAVIADAEGLRRLAQGAERNSDDLPVVAHRAALVDYAPEALPRQRLGALLEALPLVPDGVLGGDGPDHARLAAYWHARDQYLKLGLQLRPDPDPRAMLERLGPPLSELLAQSPEFQPAADALAGLARDLQDSDYALAQQVLSHVRALQGSAAAALPFPNPSQR